MKILVIIPARGGSKGIPLKNIYPLANKPLIEYTIESILNTKNEFTVAVSTDSDEIAQVVSKYSEVHIVKRPENLSGDNASTESTLLHCIEWFEKEKYQKFDYVITLQPTSPFRKSETIDKFVSEFINLGNEYDAQLTLTENYTDFWVQDSVDNFSRLYKNASRRRQERKPLYAENSCIYITSVQTLKETKSVLGSKINGFVIDEIEGFDINEMVDIKIAESYIINLKGEML